MAPVIAPILFPTLAGTQLALATAGINLALYAGVSAASLLLQQSMMPNQKQETGTKLVSVLGGAVNQAIHFGAKETAGSFLYKNSWGIAGRVPNAFLVRVYCLSDRRVDGFENYVWAGNRKCNYDPGSTQIIGGVNVGHPIDAFDNNGDHRLWVKFHDGTQTVADGYLTTKFSGDVNRPWTSDHVGRGRAYMIVTQKYDKKEPSGEIDVVAVIKASRYYDWRDGGQAYGTYSSYASEPGNPIVSAYNTMRGVYDGTEWMFGGQKWPAMRFDTDSWTAAANRCDTNVALAGGGTQKWARMGAEVDCSEEPWTVVERQLKTCGGRLVESGGVFKVYVGGIGASVYSFTDDDILVSEEFTARLFPTRDQIANTIVGTYVEPANAGEAKAFKARFKQDYIDEDGDVRKSTMDFEYGRDNRQAQRFAKLALNDNRRFRSFVVAFWTQARKLEPCDVVSWTSERFAFSNKKFIVGDVTLREDGVVIVNLREADATDADWSTADEDGFETGVYADVDAAPQAITPTFTAVSITDDDNATKRRPAIRIRATLDDDFVDCRALLWEVRKRNGDQATLAEGESKAFFDPANPKYGDITIARSAFLPGRRVQVRVKIDPESDRETEWSNWSTTSFYPGGNSYLELDDSKLDTIDLRGGAVLGADSITVRKNNWNQGSNGSDTRALFKNAVIANASGSPILMSWNIRVSINFTLNGAPGNGSAQAALILILKHVESGEEFNLGKFENKSTDKKSANSKTFKGAYLFGQMKKGDASFTLTAVHSRNFKGAKYDKAKFTVSGPSPVEARRWKV